MSFTFGDPRIGENFWQRVIPEPNTGCWLWLGGRGSADGAYGRWSDKERGHKLIAPYRFTYERLVGPIPEGLTIDHVRARGCCGGHCCNPDHLEPVTHTENNRRADGLGGINYRKTHCKRGHEFDLLNTYRYQGRRYCITCRDTVHAARQRAQRKEVSHHTP